MVEFVSDDGRRAAPNQQRRALLRRLQAVRKEFDAQLPFVEGVDQIRITRHGPLPVLDPDPPTVDWPACQNNNSIHGVAQ